MKRRLRYKVVVNGATISRHFTLASARKASRKLLTNKARVKKIGYSRRKRY